MDNPNNSIVMGVKMTQTNKIKKYTTEVVRGIKWGAGISAAYLGLLGITVGATVALNTPPIALQAGIEAILDQPKQEYVGRVCDSGRAELIQTHGHINYWTIELPEGITRRVYDSPRILEGKLWANSFPELEVGRSYIFSTIGSDRLGYTLLDAQESN